MDNKNNHMDYEKLYFDIINTLDEGIYFVDLERKIRFWNKAAEQITGYAKEEMIGRCCADNILNHIDEDGRALCLMNCPLFDTMADGEERKAKVFARHKDGYRVPICVHIFPIKQEERIVGAVEIFSKESTTVYDDHLIEHLSSIATHDPLTQLSNRRNLEDFLQYKWEEYTSFQHPFAVLFADIDNFRYFNNTYGHDVGDVVLKTIASTISCNTRKGDMAGRWGGEEFLCIYSIENPQDAVHLGECFLNLIRATNIYHDGQTHSVTMSAGVAVIRPDDTIETVVERADHLMYQSKEKGKNQVTVCLT